MKMNLIFLKKDLIFRFFANELVKRRDFLAFQGTIKVGNFIKFPMKIDRPIGGTSKNKPP